MYVLRDGYNSHGGSKLPMSILSRKIRQKISSENQMGPSNLLRHLRRLRIIIKLANQTYAMKNRYPCGN